jgi:hypothetical protein
MKPGRQILGLLTYDRLEYFFKRQVGKEKAVSGAARIHKLPGDIPIFFCSVSPAHNLFGNVNHWPVLSLHGSV